MDLEQWATHKGLENWTYADCLPYYKKPRLVTLVATTIMVIAALYQWLHQNGNNVLFHAMVEAGVQAGYPRTDDLNGYQQEGFGPMDCTVTPKGRRRSSTARGYLDMAKGRPNLTILTHATTNKILFNQSKQLVLNTLLVLIKTTATCLG